LHLGRKSAADRHVAIRVLLSARHGAQYRHGLVVAPR
jgi:hypothetical protein